MNIEMAVPIILGFYMFISVVLLLYNLMYIIRHRSDERRHETAVRKWISEVRTQLHFLQSKAGAHVSPEHLSKLEGKLRLFSNLIAYHGALQSLSHSLDIHALRAYIAECSSAFETLVNVYVRRDDTQKAYFAHLVSDYPETLGEKHLPDDELLIPYLVGASVYCRQNTLCALNALGNANAVEKAFLILAEQGVFHHDILLTRTLMTFSRDKGVLASKLWQHVGKWPAHMGIAVVNFIAQSGQDFAAEFLESLRHPALLIEVRIAMLRYFAEYPHKLAHATIIDFLQEPNAGSEEFLAAAAWALSAYPGPLSIHSLKMALTSSYWNVRYAAAGSLLAMESNEKHLDDVLHGSDRYASDMLLYHMRASGPLTQTW